MPVVPASRVNALSGEGAFEVLVAARRLEAAGRHVVHLQIGEPDGATPPNVVEAAVRALHDGQTRYVNPAGLPVLRHAIAASLAWRGVRGAASENIVVVPGAKPMVFYALLAVLEAGDEVLVPDPGFPIYPSVVRFAGAVPVRYSLDARGGVDAERLTALVGPRTRAVVVNLPGNPTGGVATPDALHAIAELALRHDLVVISDEVYGRIRYDGREDSIAALPGIRCTRPDGAFYAFPDVRQVEERSGLSTRELAARLLDEYGVAVLPGTDFGPGGAGHLRLSFAVSPADLDLALDRIRECVSDLAVASLTDGGIHVGS